MDASLHATWCTILTQPVPERVLKSFGRCHVRKPLKSTESFSMYRDVKFEPFHASRQVIMNDSDITKAMLKSQVLQKQEATTLGQYGKIKLSHALWFVYPVIFYYCWEGITWW